MILDNFCVAWFGCTVRDGVHWVRIPEYIWVLWRVGREQVSRSKNESFIIWVLTAGNWTPYLQLPLSSNLTPFHPFILISSSSSSFSSSTYHFSSIILVLIPILVFLILVFSPFRLLAENNRLCFLFIIIVCYSFILILFSYSFILILFSYLFILILSLIHLFLSFSYIYLFLSFH